MPHITIEKVRRLKEAQNPLLEAVARGWCSEANKHKEMDSALAYAIVNQVKPLLGAIVDLCIAQAGAIEEMKEVTQRLQDAYNVDDNKDPRYYVLGILLPRFDRILAERGLR